MIIIIITIRIIVIIITIIIIVIIMIIIMIIKFVNKAQIQQLVFKRAIQTLTTLAATES